MWISPGVTLRSVCLTPSPMTNPSPELMQLELCGLSVFCASDRRIGSSGLSARNIKITQDTKHFVPVLVPGALDCSKPKGRVWGGW